MLDLDVPPADIAAIDALADCLRNRRIIVLTGAGCSTESGIPDYRGPGTKRRSSGPMRYQEFVGSADARRHYWARSAIGWPEFTKAQPNDGHRALASLESVGHVRGLITQNVDRLHRDAGSTNVVELHGALADVICLDCGKISGRHTLQERMLSQNPGWTKQAAELIPDGDADLPRHATQHFEVPACTACGGVLKPDVVFFGEDVPAARTEAAWDLMDAGDALLVAGSSLTVYSGYRFVREAAARDWPIVIVNLGSTRGDEHATLRLEARLGDVLPRLVRALTTAAV